MGVGSPTLGNEGSTPHYADWPVSENDLHARHAWLVEQRKTFVPRLEGDPDFFDPKIAGWWCWGICCWIGGQFCSGQGPWQVVKGQLVHSGDPGPGIQRRRVAAGRPGQGVNRQRIAVGNSGRGVNRPFLQPDSPGLLAWMEALANRLRLVRVCCGDFSRILSPTVTVKQGMTGVFLDPPYTAKAKRAPDLYRIEDLNIGHQAATWAFEHGDNPLLRIALCGYEGEYEIPDHWTKYEWKAGNSYGNSQASPENRHKERIWFSPACLASAEPLDLFRD